MQLNFHPHQTPRHVRILRWDPRLFREHFRFHTLEAEVNAALQLGWTLGAVSGFCGGSEFILFWCHEGEPQHTPFQLWSNERTTRRVRNRPIRRREVVSGANESN